MNENIKQGFQNAFIHQPSTGFTDEVLRKTKKINNLKINDKSNKLVLIAVFVGIMGLPIFVIILGILFDIQMEVFDLNPSTNFSIHWIQWVMDSIVKGLPYLLYMLVFYGVFTLGNFLQLKKIKFY